MKTLLLCCKTIEHEIQLAMEQTGVHYPIRWVESGLHNIPSQLTDRLRQELHALPPDTDRLLLGFGYCGNAITGLSTGSFEMIVPRADDCITLMLGSYRRRQEIMEEAGSYFLTEGWLNGERNIWVEFEHARARYGEARARKLYASMLSHYSRLAVVDTGAYDVERICPTTEMIARELGLRHEVLPGSMDLFRRLLTGPWDDDTFLTIPPNSTITAQQLRMPQQEE